MNDEGQLEFFFWLEDDGLAQSVTEEQFVEKIENAEEAERKWRNVEIDRS